MDDIQIKIAAVITQDDKVLLIKERNTIDNKYYWNLITGTFDISEDKGLLGTVIRECREEANTEVEIRNLINIVYYRKEDKIRLQFGFLCEANAGKSFLSNAKEQAARDEDITEIRPFSRDELLEIRREDFMSNRAYATLSDFLQGKAIDTSAIREIIKL